MNKLIAMGKIRHQILLLLVMGWVWSNAPVQAQGAGAITLEAQAGFDGFYKSDFGVPVQIRASNDGPAVEGELRVTINPGSTNNRLVYNSPISLPTQSSKRVTLYVHVSGFVNELEVVLLDAEERPITAASTNRLSQIALGDLLYGVISPDPGELSSLENATGRRGKAAVAYLDMADLPEAPPAWNALDVLVLNDVDTGELTAGQLDALKSWVSTGGQLVITGGPGWQKTVANLSEMLPVAINGSESLDDLPFLSEWAGVPFRDPGPYLVTTSSLQNGELLIHQDGLPLLARRSWGRGAVYFLALDPKLAPLLDWDGSERLWGVIAGETPTLPAWGLGIRNSYAASTAITSLPSLALPSVLQLIFFLFLYVLIMGPANYLVLKRIGRRELAWATIPALVLVFSVMAYITGFQLKGNEIIINEMSIAYGRLGSEQMRAQTLLGLYSPRRSTYDLTLPGDVLARPFERNFGGIGGGGRLAAITRGRELTLSRIRVDVSDTQTFIAESVHETPNVSGKATLTLAEGNLRLEVSIQNNGDTPLENASILLGTDVVSLGDIAPGRTATSSRIIGAAATSSGAPGLASPPVYYGPGPGPSPLMAHADTILGTSDYYNDRDAYPRWQLLQALEGEPYRTGPRTGSSLPAAENVITLIAWSKQPLLDVTLDREEYSTLHTTLYFLELLLEQNILTGDNVSVPLSLLDWEVLEESGTYDASIQNLYLQGGWVEFEYRPWGGFQAMQVKQLAVVLEPGGDPSAQPAPEVRLWNWQEDLWVTLTSAGWGVTPVQQAERYVGPGNAVRLLLRGNESYGLDIREVYPLLTGNIP